jgi:hypothetical protein
MRSIESKHHHNDLRTSVCPVVNSYKWRPKRTSGRHVLAGQLRYSPRIDARSVAHKINISALEISPDQLYAQLVANICTLLSLCQQSFYSGL